MNLREKVLELIQAADADQSFADSLEEQAQEYLAQFEDWPVSTQVPLARVAYILAGLIVEPNPKLRRVRVTDRLELRSQLG